MTFLKLALAPWIFLGLTLCLLFAWWQEKRFFSWVRAHWFVKRSPWQWLGGLCVSAGLVLLSVVLLDPRSGEIRIKGKVRQDRTIILIDTSSSMLVEDVRPNRLEKAVLLAKHFVRKAAGQQIAVMVFADITKKLVPFTTDLDLLDSRIDSVKMLRNLNAGSSIGLAIEEAVQFFDPKDKSVSGNILVITDGEDNANTESFRIPEGISVALVGVGTKEGGPIPMKDRSGINFGNRKERGETIISRINLKFFETACDNKPNCQFYIAQSYDLPTDQILDFMGKRKAQEREADNLVRPVAMEVWAVPGVALLIVGIILRTLRPFALGLLVFSLGLASAPALAEEEGPTLSPQTLLRLEQMRRGELDAKEKINLADQLVKEKAHPLAQKIYQEQLGDKPLEGQEDSYFNWATSELDSKNFNRAFEHYDRLEKALKKTNPQSPLIGKMRENIRKAVASESQSPQQNKDQDKKDQRDQKEQKKGNDQQQSQDQNQGQGQGEGQSKPDQGKEEQKQDGKNPFDTKNKDKKDEQSGDEKEKQDQGEDAKDRKEEQKPEQGDKGEEQEKKRPKVSPLFEQLKQDDRKLQLKLLDVSTQKKTKERKKDW